MLMAGSKRDNELFCGAVKGRQLSTVQHLNSSTGSRPCLSVNFFCFRFVLVYPQKNAVGNCMYTSMSRNE